MTAHLLTLHSRSPAGTTRIRWPASVRSTHFGCIGNDGTHAALHLLPIGTWCYGLGGFLSMSFHDRGKAMRTTTKPLLAMNAGDVMSCDLVLLTESMPLREAAHRLLHNQIGGAPVVDAHGKCVGVVSAIDFLRLAEKCTDIAKPASPPLPVTCAFQTKHRMQDGSEVVLCTLPIGVCSIRERQTA